MSLSLKDRALGLIQEAKVWFRFRAGLPIVSDDSAASRFAICLPCEHYIAPGAIDKPADGIRLRAKFGSCELCGCLIIAKTMLATANCPDNPPRWNAIVMAKEPGFFASAERQAALVKELNSWKGTRFFQRAAPAVKGVRCDCVSFVERALVNLGAIHPIVWPAYVTHFGGVPMLDLLLKTLENIPELTKIWAQNTCDSGEQPSSWAQNTSPGDLLACSAIDRGHHLAIYGGNNTVWHATKKDGVCTGNLKDPLIEKHLIAVYRVFSTHRPYA